MYTLPSVSPGGGWRRGDLGGVCLNRLGFARPRAVRQGAAAEGPERAPEDLQGSAESRLEAETVSRDDEAGSKPCCPASQRTGRGTATTAFELILLTTLIHL